MARNRHVSPAPADDPTPLPRGMLADLARIRGILLCLDYDGTLAEFTVDPGQSHPVDGAREYLERIAHAGGSVVLAIVTGRRIEQLRNLVRLRGPVLYSGLHGLEFETPDRGPQLSPEAMKCFPELDRVRQWLRQNVPDSRGFRIEDKIAAVGLHYREADPAQARALCDRFAEFVAASTPLLKVVPLKMIAEAIPRAASKGRAIEWLKAQVPRHFATVYFGDDSTDEDAFAALGPDDVGVLIGSERRSHARYRLDNPRAVIRELADLGAAVTGS